MFIFNTSPHSLLLLVCMLLSQPNLLTTLQGSIAQDRKLAKSIAQLKVEILKPVGCRLIVTSTVDGLNEVNEKLVWIVRIANSLTPITEVCFNGHRISMRALAIVSPSVTISAGVRDRKLHMQQRRQRIYLLETTITALTNDYSVFFLSPEGRYEDVYFQNGTQPLISAERIVGRFLCEIIGHSAAKTVLKCLQNAQKTRQFQECQYEIVFPNHEQRWYFGRAYPSPMDGQIQLLTVKRLS